MVVILEWYWVVVIVSVRVRGKGEGFRFFPALVTHVFCSPTNHYSYHSTAMVHRLVPKTHEGHVGLLVSITSLQ